MLSRRNKCVESKSWCLGMLLVCLMCSFMRLGVPFIAPRQLGVVESNPGRQFLPSVAWRTGQSGAPPDTVRCGSPSLFGEADRWCLGAVGAPDTAREQQVRLSQPGAPDTIRCTTGHCLVHHRTVRCTQTKPSLGCSSQDISNRSFPVSST
jgi:hypothetical protein